ncbi:uncharacterized protein [Panulirus ornatus]|uniref:uncharacterized protein n=1 Tax=Panulirus ornatus TaxID=150431 RepID=UPI003A86BF07
MMAWQRFLLLLLLMMIIIIMMSGSVLGVSYRQPDVHRISRSAAGRYLSPPGDQALFLRSTPLDARSTGGDFLQVESEATRGDIVSPNNQALQNYPVPESPLGISRQAARLPPQLAVSSASTRKERFSDPIPLPSQTSHAGSKTQGGFSIANTIDLSPKLDKTGTTQPNTEEATSGDIGRTIANILYQLTDGAVQSLDTVSIPNPKFSTNGKVHIYTATDPKEKRAPPPQQQAPIILQPREETRAFIALSPPNLRGPFSVLASTAPHAPHQHLALPVTYQQRPFQHASAGEGNAFISTPLTSQEPTASFTGSRESFDRNEESLNDPNFLVSIDENHGDVLDTHLNTEGNIQSTFSSSGNTGTTINRGTSFGPNFHPNVWNGPFVHTSSTPAAQNVKPFPPARKTTSSAVHTSAADVQSVPIFTPTELTGPPPTQTFTPTLQNDPFNHQSDPSTQNVQPFTDVEQTGPLIQTFTNPDQNDPFHHVSDTFPKNVQTFPSLESSPDQNDPFHHISDPFPQNVHTFPSLESSPDSQIFTPIQDSPFAHTSDPDGQNILQTFPPIQTGAAVQTFAPTVHNTPFLHTSDPALQNVQTFPSVQTGSADETFAPTYQKGSVIHTSTAAVQRVHTFPPTFQTSPNAQSFVPEVQSGPGLPSLTNTIQNGYNAQTSDGQTNPIIQHFAPAEQNAPTLDPVDQSIQTFSHTPEPALSPGFPSPEVHTNVHSFQYDPSSSFAGSLESGVFGDTSPDYPLTFPGEDATPQTSFQFHQTFFSDSPAGGTVFDNPAIQTYDGQAYDGEEFGPITDASGTAQGLSFGTSYNGFEVGGGPGAVSTSNIYTESDSTGFDAAQSDVSTAAEFRTNSFAGTDTSLQAGLSTEGHVVPLPNLNEQL